VPPELKFKELILKEIIVEGSWPEGCIRGGERRFK
jgi:hypothetical protein